jgi:riboflavin kinase
VLRQLRLFGGTKAPHTSAATCGLQVPPGYRFSAAPVVMEGTVVTGFGRGSRQLGVPTANMDPVPLQQQLQQLPRGVYFGWAQLDAPGEWPAADSAVHKMVMNVGRRPTVNTGTCMKVCSSIGFALH